MKRLYLLMPAALALGGAFLYTSFWPVPPAPSSQESPSHGTAEFWVQGVGYLEPVGEVRRLAFKINGVIGRCLADVGQTARQGDVLMVLRDEEQTRAVATAAAELDLAKAEQAKLLSGTNKYRIAAGQGTLEMLRERLHHAITEHARTRQMFQSRAASEVEIEEARTSLVQGECAVRNAEAELLYLNNCVTEEDRQVAAAKVRLAHARLDAARQQLRDTVLRAPFDGAVLEVLRREGEAVRLTDTEPAVAFGDLSRFQVRGEVDERYALAVRQGQAAVVFGRGLGQETLAGRVSCVKRVMGKKTLFSAAATERKDLDVLQVFVETAPPFRVPAGLEVDLKIRIGG
jgi:HlyD family secretion protein